jgi:malate dehydrogenase
MDGAKKIVVTGAAGQISYSLIFRIGAGDFLGSSQPVELRLLEVEPAMDRLEGVCMEISDCAFPLVSGYRAGFKAEEIFDGADYAFLVGAMPRKEGMERKDLLEANARIFSEQGRALDKAANRDVKVVVVGNPANTNALIAYSNAGSLPARNFTAMTRLDHNRAMSQVAAKAGVPVTNISRVAIWGNHSSTQYPDLHHALVDGRSALERVGAEWYRNEMIPAVQQRGAAIIKARGASSAASAASSAIDHMRDWALGTPENDWTSMGVVSEGQYGVEPGLVYSYPVTCRDGEWTVVEDLEADGFSLERMKATEAELSEERGAVKAILG